MESRTRTNFTVRISADVARVLECEDATGTIQFTLDAGSKGDNSICLEHHPASWLRGPRYELCVPESQAVFRVMRI